MNNEHNPIAIRVGRVQDLWIASREENPAAKLYCLTCQTEDYPIVEGFIRLESSPYGKTHDTFTAFMTDYDTTDAFYAFLSEEWIRAFDADLKTYPDWNWTDFEDLKKEFAEIDRTDTNALKLFYIRLISSFKQFEGIKDNVLAITVIVSRVSDTDTLNQAIEELVKLFPPQICFVLVDYGGRELYQPVIKELGKAACLIEVPDQDMAGACKEIATQGDPNDPQVKYRRCLFEIGEAANGGKKHRTKELGNELVQIARGIGGTELWASAYLIYGGCMLSFRDEVEYTLQLLDKGIAIVEPGYRENKEYSQVLMQLYNYKGIAYNLANQLKEAVGWFLRGMQIAREAEQKFMAVNEYNYALLSALRTDRLFYEPILEEAFEYGYALDDDELENINLSFIASTYINKVSGVETEKRAQINERMSLLYGENWQATSKELTARMEEEYQLPKK